MTKSLYFRFTLAFMLVAFTSAAIVAVFIRVTSNNRLSQLIVDQQRSTLVQSLAEYYTVSGSWDGAAAGWREIQRRNNTFTAPPNNGHTTYDPASNPPPGWRERRDLFGLADQNGQVVVPIDTNYVTGEKLPANILKQGTPVIVNNVQVGTLLVASQQPLLNPEEALFLARTNQALLLGSLGALIVALFMGILLARTLTRPLQALTQAAQNIASGKLNQQVQVTSKDEIGQLGQAFNQMSQEVARANQLRRQMTADIAHDLRTPLTVIGGYVESMRDGVLQPTGQRLTLIYAEIERLQKMVGDLRMLSQVDAGELPLQTQRISPLALVERASEIFQHQAEHFGVTLSAAASSSLPDIQIDEARMMQVMDNLISNAFRYTPEGGRITLSARVARGKVEITVQDTGSGIAPEELPLVFNRFHRGDTSRHSDNGESGLGLAIVKALVESNGGRIWAESILGEGTQMHMEFPALPDVV